MYAATISRSFSLAFIALAGLVAGCANLNPLALANTPAQRYDAIRLTYDALLTPAQVFVQDANAPLEARRTVQAAAATSGELYASLTKSYADFLVARAQVAAGTTPAAKLDIATANLERWVTQLEDALAGLARALPGI